MISVICSGVSGKELQNGVFRGDFGASLQAAVSHRKKPARFYSYLRSLHRAKTHFVERSMGWKGMKMRRQIPGLTRRQRRKVQAVCFGAAVTQNDYDKHSVITAEATPG